MANNTIVLVTKDLFFVPTFRTAAEKLGAAVVVALSVDSDKLASLSAEEVAAWIIDLSSVSVAAIPSLVETLDRQFPDARKIAFGPHVQAERLAAAERAGCQQVLSRGQISSQIDRLMGQWLTAPGV